MCPGFVDLHIHAPQARSHLLIILNGAYGASLHPKKDWLPCMHIPSILYGWGKWLA